MPEMRKEYKQQAMLVVQVLPLLAAHPDFALKGGTAINYFLRPFPRLSVDIDLAFLPLMPRELSLEMISISLDGLKEEILSRYPGLSIQQKKLQARTAAPRVAQGSSTIKIEPNLVVRGSVYPAVEKDIAEEVEKELGYSVRVAENGATVCSFLLSIRIYLWIKSYHKDFLILL